MSDRTAKTLAFIATALFVVWWIDDQTAGFLRPDWIF
jgi:hypothetical protein